MVPNFGVPLRYSSPDVPALATLTRQWSPSFLSFTRTNSVKEG